MIILMLQRKWRLIELYELVSVATNIFDIIVTFSFFDNLLSWKEIKTYKKFLFGVFMFAMTLLSNLLVYNNVLTILISMGIMLVVTVGFEGKLSKKVMVVIGYMLLVIIADFITALIGMRFLLSDVNTLLNVESTERMIGMLISKPVILILVRSILLMVNKQDIQMYRQCGLALLTVPLANIVLIIAIVHFFDNIQLNNEKTIYIASLCVLYNTIIVFYLFERITKNALLENKCNILENQIIIQAETAKKDEEYNNKIKTFRHDLKIHFQALYHMIVNEYFERAKKYLEDTKLVEKVSTNDIHTGNIAFDAIMNAKLAEAEQAGINTRVMCQMPKDVEIDDIDICVLFGNLLDMVIRK